MSLDCGIFHKNGKDKIQYYMQNSGVESAEIILHNFYPDFPKCGHPEYTRAQCIAEFCKYAPDADWTKCPYFQRKLEKDPNQ